MIISEYFIPLEIIYVFTGVYAVLIACSAVFRILYHKKKSETFKTLITKVDSWWRMVIGITIIVVAPPIIGTILIGYISFVALREMMSIGRLRASDRVAILACYLCIPIQYYLAYHNYYHEFLLFIPLVMFSTIAIILVLTGDTKLIGRSMSILPAMLMLTVYLLSYMVLLFNVSTPYGLAGSGGLILYLLALTAFNDVFQYTWGTLLGKRKILPKISPNKTWIGFIGGVLTTGVLAYLISGLTPLEGLDSFLIGLAIGVMGFLGDVLISAIKRDLKLKDTSDLIPGHGGAMDRLDSIIFTTPLFYHLLIFCM
ncbi:MAG: phosphatidate cytidylyltransferase [Crocinitomicaceae bacterium]|nr:phosphatidate cytidylyltransferase [Crocinitomicaceae bacterium]